MFNVLSFDPKRIKVELSQSGKIIVTKKTTLAEFKNIVLARRHLLKHKPILDSNHYGDILISVAEVFEWDPEVGILSTPFCKGENLETLLRTSIGDNRECLIQLIRKMFEAFKLHGFLWGDFAPRNMLWDRSRNIIWFVDFERHLLLKDCPIEQHSFNRYVRRYSREEFSCFITQAEQTLLFDGYLDEDMSGSVPVYLIASKRKYALLKTMFGEKSCYPVEEIRKAEELMSAAATPFLVNNIFFFPMDSLDSIGSAGGPDEYADTILAIRGLGNYGKFSYLKKRSAAL